MTAAPGHCLGKGVREANFRDLGGLPTTTGQRIRPGVLFRSEAPENLHEVERESLAGIRLVVDLRSDGEDIDPGAVWVGGEIPEILAVPVWTGGRRYAQDTLVRMCTDSELARTYMTEMYAEILDALPHTCMRELAERVGEGQRVPVLIHCAAGQDRTGVLVAVLLLALGVPRDVVVADYVRSAESWDRARLTQWMLDLLGPGDHAFSEVALDQLLAGDHHIETVLDRLLAGHGSIDQYWASAGVDEALLRQMRAVLCG